MRVRLGLTGVALLAAVGLLAGCGGKPATPPAQQPAAPAPAPAPAPESKELIIYSGRNEKLVKPVLEAFEKESGIKVTLRSGGATELAAAILEEKANPKADIYLANDAGALEKLRKEAVLAPYLSEKVKAVPADLRSPDGSWTAVTARARVIMYNKQLVPESELPRSIFDLANPKWKGQIAMASVGNESVIANVTSLRLARGDAETEKFLQGLKANGIKVLGGHTDVRQAVGKGEFKLGWVNHYYYHLQLAEKENNNVGIVYPDQGAGDMGAVVNISGVAVVKGSRNQANAQKFVDFLLTPAAQKLFAELNYEMPVLPGVPVKDARPLADYKRANAQLAQFGSEWDKTVQLMDKVNLKGN